MYYIISYYIILYDNPAYPAYILQSWSISSDLWSLRKKPFEWLQKRTNSADFMCKKIREPILAWPMYQTCSKPKKNRGLWMVIVFHWFNLLNSKTCLVSLVICTQIKRGHVPSVFPKFSCTNSDNHPFPSNLFITKPHMESPPICFCQTTCSKRSRTREAPIPAKISTNSEALMLKKGTPASPKRGLRGVVRCNPWNDGLEPGGFGIRIGVWVGTPSVPMPIPFIRGSQNIHNHPRERCQLSICWSWKRDGNKMGTVTTTKRWRGCNYCHRIQSFGQNTKKKEKKIERVEVIIWRAK